MNHASPNSLNRRDILSQFANGFGMLALSGLMAETAGGSTPSSFATACSRRPAA
jgi:hypothetical protein